MHNILFASCILSNTTWILTSYSLYIASTLYPYLALTMDSAASFTAAGKSAKKPLVMACGDGDRQKSHWLLKTNHWGHLLTVKMALRLTSEGEGRQNMAKCLMSLGVTGLRPPPGGAQAAQIVTSWVWGTKVGRMIDRFC